MSLMIRGIGRYGLEAQAKQEYQTFAAQRSDHGALARAAKLRQVAAKKGGGKWAEQMLAEATKLEQTNTTNVNRAFVADSIKKLNDGFSNGFAGDDAWAHASYQARMKAAFSDFRDTGGTYGELQQRVLDGIQDPYLRTALLGHPGLAR